MHIRLVKLYSVQGKVVMNKLSFNRQCKPCHLTKFVTFFSANLLGSILHIIIILPRVVAKISSCRVNTTSRRGIKHRGVSFGSNFLLFSNKSSPGPHS